MAHFSRSASLICLLFAASAGQAAAQLVPQPRLPGPDRADPLNVATLTIVAIDIAQGAVTAADHVRGQRARIEVADRRVLRALRVGQQVTRNRASSDVMLGGRPLGRLAALVAGGSQSGQAPAPPADVVARCQEESRRQSQAGVVCVPMATLVSTGSSPGPEDDTYSWTCVC